MTIDVFYRSYRGDFEWLKYSLESTYKFVKGFNEVHICVPADDIGLLKSKNERVHLTKRWEDDYMGQQADKLYADIHCHSDFILHIDSDCLWTHEVDLEQLFEDGKPVMLHEECLDSPWPKISQAALGFIPKYEFMRRHPFIYPRDLYAEFRRWMFNRHECEIGQFIQRQQGRHFSEFHTFGAWCYEYKRDRFAWKKPSEFPSFVKQWRSWDGLTPEIEKEIHLILHGKETHNSSS